LATPAGRAPPIGRNATTTPTTSMPIVAAAVLPASSVPIVSSTVPTTRLISNVRVRSRGVPTTCESTPKPIAPKTAYVAIVGLPRP
jgi:hypothetical protein